MEYEKFLVWLKSNKNLGERSARDVVSRLRRAMAILGKDYFPEDALQELNAKPEFLELTMSVKSQLRRAVTLYSEFEK